MATIKLAFVHSFTDVRGKRRHVFRRERFPTVTIKGRPGSAEFMEHYHALLRLTDNPNPNVGASRIAAGGIDALILRYLRHESFTNLAKASQTWRRPVLDRFRDFKTPNGRRYGDNKISNMVQSDVAAVLHGKKPNVKKNWLKVLRHLIAFAIEERECRTDCTIGMKTTRPPKSHGHPTWGMEQVELYRQTYPIGTMARLAIELGLNIAARRNDAYRIGRQHLRNGCLSWRPSKTSKTTGKMLTIRMLPGLQAALDAMPRSDALTFLLTERGRPFASSAAFGNKFADWVRAAGVEPILCDDGITRNYRFHGLRKCALTQLAHAGATGPELMAVSGHASLAQVQPYIADAEQARMADAAMLKRTKADQAVANKDG